MANKKISELDDLSTVTSDDLAVVVDISTLSTRKASMANLKSYFQSELPRPKTEIISITSAHIADKSVTLTNAPLSGYNVTILPRGGCVQFNAVDFVISGTAISWGGYGLDSLLEDGDIIQVDYYY